MSKDSKALLLSILILVSALSFFLYENRTRQPALGGIDPFPGYGNRTLGNFTVDLKDGCIIVQETRPVDCPSGCIYMPPTAAIRHENGSVLVTKLVAHNRSYSELEESCPDKLNMTVKQANQSFGNGSLCPLSH